MGLGQKADAAQNDCLTTLGNISRADSISAAPETPSGKLSFDADSSRPVSAQNLSVHHKWPNIVLQHAWTHGAPKGRSCAQALDWLYL